MAMITANINHNIVGSNNVSSWAAPSDCVVNINGSMSGSLKIDSIVVAYAPANSSTMFSITGEPIKAGQTVSINIGQARIAGFTV